MMSHLNEPNDEFLWNTHSYINEYIRFVDAKAELVIGWTSALMGLLLAGKFHHAFMLVIENGFWAKIEGVAAILGFLTLTIAFMFSFIAVIPRLKTTQTPGYIFWDNILGHKRRDDFVASVIALPDNEQAKQVAEHLFDLSSVCNEKFWWVNRSIYLAFAGSLICGVAYFAFDLPKNQQNDKVKPLQGHVSGAKEFVVEGPTGGNGTKSLSLVESISGLA